MSVIEKFKTMEYGPAPEDPKESLQWLDRHHRRFGHFIGGAWTLPAEGKYFETCDPSTGEKIAEVAQGGAADIAAAVKAARGISTRWRAMCKNTLGAWPCSKPSTMASPSARAATSTFPWWRGISITTLAGRGF